MGKTLYCANMGGNINNPLNDSYGQPCDMPTFRSCICFRDGNGRIIYGDVSHGLTYDYDAKCRPCNPHPANLAVDLEVQITRPENYYGETIDVPHHTSPMEAYDIARGKHYNRADVLAFVSEMAGEKYDAIEFLTYTDWKTTPQVAGLIIERDAQYDAACDRLVKARAEIDAKRSAA